jgi:hypothetical protein
MYRVQIDTHRLQLGPPQPWILPTVIAANGKRFIVRADEMLTAFVELESTTNGLAESQSKERTVAEFATEFSC